MPNLYCLRTSSCVQLTGATDAYDCAYYIGSWARPTESSSYCFWLRYDTWFHVDRKCSDLHNSQANVVLSHPAFFEFDGNHSWVYISIAAAFQWHWCTNRGERSDPGSTARGRAVIPVLGAHALCCMKRQYLRTDCFLRITPNLSSCLLSTERNLKASYHCNIWWYWNYSGLFIRSQVLKTCIIEANTQ